MLGRFHRRERQSEAPAPARRTSQRVRVHDPFEAIEHAAGEHPQLERALLSAANRAGRSGRYRVSTVRQALVRLGVLAAYRVVNDTMGDSSLEETSVSAA